MANGSYYVGGTDSLCCYRIPDPLIPLFTGPSKFPASPHSIPTFSDAVLFLDAAEVLYRLAGSSYYHDRPALSSTITPTGFGTLVVNRDLLDDGLVSIPEKPGSSIWKDCLKVAESYIKTVPFDDGGYRDIGMYPTRCGAGALVYGSYYYTDDSVGTYYHSSYHGTRNTIPMLHDLLLGSYYWTLISKFARDLGSLRTAYAMNSALSGRCMVPEGAVRPRTGILVRSEETIEYTYESSTLRLGQGEYRYSSFNRTVQSCRVTHGSQYLSKSSIRSDMTPSEQLAVYRSLFGKDISARSFDGSKSPLYERDTTRILQPSMFYDAAKASAIASTLKLFSKVDLVIRGTIFGVTSYLTEEYSGGCDSAADARRVHSMFGMPTSSFGGASVTRSTEWYDSKSSGGEPSSYAQEQSAPTVHGTDDNYTTPVGADQQENRPRPQIIRPWSTSIPTLISSYYSEGNEMSVSKASGCDVPHPDDESSDGEGDLEGDVEPRTAWHESRSARSVESMSGDPMEGFQLKRYDDEDGDASPPQKFSDYRPYIAVDIPHGVYGRVTSATAFLTASVQRRTSETDNESRSFLSWHHYPGEGEDDPGYYSWELDRDSTQDSTRNLITTVVVTVEIPLQMVDPRSFPVELPWGRDRPDAIQAQPMMFRSGLTLRGILDRVLSVAGVRAHHLSRPISGKSGGQWSAAGCSLSTAMPGHTSGQYDNQFRKKTNSVRVSLGSWISNAYTGTYRSESSHTSSTGDPGYTSDNESDDRDSLYIPFGEYLSGVQVILTFEPHFTKALS